MNTKFNRKQIIVFILLVLNCIVLFLTTYSNVQLDRIDNIKVVSKDINNKKSAPKDLFIECYTTTKHSYYSKDLNNQDFARWKKRYHNQIKTEEDAYVAINSMLQSLNDPYSKFLSKEEFLAQNKFIDSKFEGIGVNVASVSGKIYIINVIKNAPAYNNGIKPGDIILRINDNDINGQSIYQVTRLIRADKNQSIKLELLRGSNKFIKNIKREEIKIKTVDYKKLDNDIGYIRISSFIGANTPKDFIVALNRLNEAKALVIDLRGNSGGLFQNAIAISNLFLDKGTIVQVIARNGKKNTYPAKIEGCICKKPLALLVDEDSASASEIMSSALKDNNRAVLIGTKTYGKGLVQRTYAMPNSSGLNLTIAKYLTPNGADINKKGIKPDYTIGFSMSDYINKTDPQLDYAKKYLTEVLKKGENYAIGFNQK